MSTQLTLNFDPALCERWPSLRQYVAFLAQTSSKPMKAQAADMDMAPSMLSRKLNPSEGDTQRMNLDDLEAWLASMGEDAVLALLGYMASKHSVSDVSKTARLITRIESLIDELPKALVALKEVSWPLP